jgi:hypothetical protein
VRVSVWVCGYVSESECVRVSVCECVRACECVGM